MKQLLENTATLPWAAIDDLSRIYQEAAKYTTSMPFNPGWKCFGISPAYYDGGYMKYQKYNMTG